MNVRRSSLALLLTLLATFLAACGTTQPSTPATAPTAAPAATAAPVPTAAPEATSAPQATEAPQATAAVEPSPMPTATPIPLSTIGTGSTKIVWWHISTQESHRAKWQELATAYVKDHPDVTIEITVLENEAFKAKLATAMQSGSPPDIFQSWGGGVLRQYGEAGLVQDLSADLQQNGWGDSFQPGPLSLYRFGDKTYGVPWNAGMVGFWYNTELFATAGIASPPKTWDEFLQTVKTLKAAGITPLALGGRDKWPGHFYWVYLAMRLGGQSAFEQAYLRQGSFADPAFVEAGKKLKELIDLQPFQNGFLGAGYAEHQAVMSNGQAAMELMGHWAPGANQGSASDPEAYRKTLGWFPFPAVPGGAGDASDALGGGDGFAIGKNAPKAAIDFVRFLTNVQNQTDMAKAGIAVPPTVKGAEAGLDDPLIRLVQQTAGAAKYYQLYYDQYLPPAVGQAVNDSTQALFAGAETPEQVAQTIEEAAASELTR